MAPSPDAYGTHGPLILGITWVEAILATICVALRTYSAHSLVKKAEWDLFWVIIAWVTSMVSQAFLIVSVAYGTGNHIDNLTPNDVVRSQEWGWFGQIVAIFAIGFGKFAVIALLLRIQGPTHVYKGYFLHFIWISNTILNINQTVMILLQCTPVEKAWNNNIPGDCSFRATTAKVGFLQGGWAAASDLALAIYPIFVFWNLELTWRRKLGLCALMGGGFVAAAAAACKTYNIELIAATTDITYAQVPLILWAWTEMWLIIILGSVPQLRVVFKLVQERVASIRGIPDEMSPNGLYYHSGLNQQVKRPKHYDDITSFAESTAHTTAERSLSETHILAPPREIMVTSSFAVTYSDDESAVVKGTPGHAVNTTKALPPIQPTQGRDSHSWIQRKFKHIRT